MAIAHDRPSHRSCWDGALGTRTFNVARRRSAAVDSRVIPVPGASMCVRRSHVMADLVRYHFHAPAVGGNAAVAGADAAEAHPVERSAVAQGVQPSDPTAAAKR